MLLHTFIKRNFKVCYLGIDCIGANIDAHIRRSKGNNVVNIPINADIMVDCNQHSASV